MFLSPASSDFRFFRTKENEGETEIKEAPMACVVPLAITALGCFALFFFADPLLQLVGIIK